MSAEISSSNSLPSRIGRAFTTFMASSGGRVARFGLGDAMVVTGVWLGPPGGYALAVAGLLPIAAGAFNLCPIAPLWGGHFQGSRYCATRATDSERESK